MTTITCNAKIAANGQEVKYYTFYIDLPVEDFDYVQNIVTEKYKIKDYLIAHEEFNAKGEHKPHFHFIVYATLKLKNNLFKKILTDKNLFVKGKGGYRPYGCLKTPIRDLNRLKAYCLKDGNVRSSIPEEELQELSKISFKKTDTLNILKDKFIKDINEGGFHYPITPYNDWGICPDLKVNIRTYCIKFHLDNELNILRSSIERWSLLFLQVHPDIPSSDRAKFIHYFIYN